MPTPRRSQADRSRSTRTRLIAAARALFAERGYAAVPAGDIVRAAGVTRGALYHHFADKQELLHAVVEQLEEEITAEIAAVTGHQDDPWSAGIAALGRFLDICLRPEVVRISLTDAPAVLGWQAWREIEARHGLGLVTETLEAAAENGMSISAPVPVLAQLVLSACIEAALMIAHSDDADAARVRAEQALLVLLSGLGADA